MEDNDCDITEIKLLPKSTNTNNDQPSSDDLKDLQGTTEGLTDHDFEDLHDRDDDLKDLKQPVLLRPSGAKHKEKWPSVSSISDENQSLRSAHEKRRIMKNIVLISIAFLMIFNSYQGLYYLQSSLHRVSGMGMITQSVIYASLMISSFIFPKLSIKFLGHKWTMVIATSFYLLWMAANGYAVWGTMVPASILIGLAAAPLWTAKASYLTISGSRYATLSGESEATVVTRFFGIFFGIYQISIITGSVISSTVLSSSYQNCTADEATLQTCGRHHCHHDNETNPNLALPDSITVWTLVGVYIAIACAAVILMSVVIDPIPKKFLNEKEKAVAGSIRKSLQATGKHLLLKKQILISPITAYLGQQEAFYGAEFTKSFIACSVGTWKVGLVTVVLGVTNVSVSYLNGVLTKYTGRLPIITTAFITELSLHITLMTWMPDPDQEYVLFIIAGLWGFTEAIFKTQVNSLYGVLFTESSEAAFACHFLLESLGFMVAFSYSTALCTSIKLYILTSLLCVGFGFYCMVEWSERRLKGKHQLNKSMTHQESEEMKDLNEIQT